MTKLRLPFPFAGLGLRDKRLNLMQPERVVLVWKMLYLFRFELSTRRILPWQEPHLLRGHPVPFWTQKNVLCPQHQQEKQLRLPTLQQ